MITLRIVDHNDAVDNTKQAKLLWIMHDSVKGFQKFSTFCQFGVLGRRHLKVKVKYFTINDRVGSLWKTKTLFMYKWK